MRHISSNIEFEVQIGHPIGQTVLQTGLPWFAMGCHGLPQVATGCHTIAPKGLITLVPIIKNIIIYTIPIIYNLYYIIKGYLYN